MKQLDIATFRSNPSTVEDPVEVTRYGKAVGIWVPASHDPVEMKLIRAVLAGEVYVTEPPKPPVGQIVKHGKVTVPVPVPNPANVPATRPVESFATFRPAPKPGSKK